MHKVALFGLLANSALGGCPISFGSDGGKPLEQEAIAHERRPIEGYQAAAEALDWDGVRKDVVAALTDSQDWWPADWGHYGGLFIRLAWHSAGSYRVSDGFGGGDGGRIRFDPERSWRDNTNLDKARRLLEPIKRKWGKGLSWGDLLIMAGTEAIRDMGGPVIGFCGGRMDDPDGWWSEFGLGPSITQKELFPCPIDGECENTGSVSVGLIYVDAVGPHGDHTNIQGSANDVRDTFARMAMSDVETVALVGGGHAFGKMHGGCPPGQGAGDSPRDNELNPWAGGCGSGRGQDTITSGLEGPWTSQPTKWDNEYFQLLVNYDFINTTSPHGVPQYRVNTSAPMVTNGIGPVAPGAHGGPVEPVTMNTADVSFSVDAEYRQIVELFARDQSALDTAFAEAWYKLTSRDMGPVSRCLGNQVPAARPFQRPLPEPAAQMADFDLVRDDIKSLMTAKNQAGMVQLAIACAQTFRVTDFSGGCNGGRVRFANGNQAHTAHQVVLDTLNIVYQKYNGAMPDSLTWADLIVLAGSTALEEAISDTCGATVKVPFCPGRTDADGLGDNEENLGFARRVTLGAHTTVAQLDLARTLLGVSKSQLVALFGLASYGGLGGSWMVESSDTAVANFLGEKAHTAEPATLSNAYFANVLDLVYTADTDIDSGITTYEASDVNGASVFNFRHDRVLLEDATYKAAAQSFAADQQSFFNEAAQAFVRLMNADRFDGPSRNLCYQSASANDAVRAEVQATEKALADAQAEIKDLEANALNDEAALADTEADLAQARADLKASDEADSDIKFTETLGFGMVVGLTAGCLLGSVVVYWKVAKSNGKRASVELTEANVGV